jgi:hypothetical protein
MPQALHRLLYVSAAAAEMDNAELERLLDVARSSNAATGITGALLYAGGNFMQLLEGPREAVLATFARIGRNPLHRQIIELLSEPAEGREFAQWSMAFTRPGFEAFAALRRGVENGEGMALLREFWSQTAR